MSARDVGRLPVVRRGTREIVGFIGRHGVIRAYNIATARKLHDLGYAVTHVDVGPHPPLPDRPYTVSTVPGLRNELAGEAHLRGLADLLG